MRKENLPMLFPGEEGENAHEGHRARLRAKAETMGLEALPKHEALEVMLFCALPRGNTNEIAHNLLDAFGNITGVLNASEAELLRVEGVGKHVAEVLCAFAGAVKAYRKILEKKQLCIRTRADAVAFAENLFNDEIRPQTWLLLLGHEGNIIYSGRLHAGAMWLTDTTRDFIVHRALASKAHFSVILAYRGLALRSIMPVDREMLHELSQDLAGVGVSVLDYIVVTPYHTISLRRDVEMGRSPFDPAEFGRSVHEIWMSDPGDVWEADEDRSKILMLP